MELENSCHYRRVVLVDSTRSGKKFPDALSKTVPIWCEVINRAISLQHLPAVGASHLRTPASSVSAQEHHQMEFKIDGWAKDLAASATRLRDFDIS
jgi:tRNA A64-2'-O-ribosylphosphate transferase